MENNQSTLRAGLRRLDTQLKPVEDVHGLFTPELPVQNNSRLYGTLMTHDAVMRVGFDGTRLKLPPAKVLWMSVSGKAWLDERTSTVTLMVNRYTVQETIAPVSNSEAQLRG
jgi:hypothetical protein